MKLEIKREALFGGPLSRGKKYHYVAYLDGQQITSASTKPEAENAAAKELLGAWRCQTQSPFASLCADGAILVTREYAPGQVDYGFHRAENKGRPSGICMGRCEINSKRVSVEEYHNYVLRMYNEAVTPVQALVSEAAQ